MNKISGYLSDFSLIAEDASRVIIGYGLTQIEESDMYEWYEVYLYKSKLQQLNIKVVRDAVNNDINSQTDEKILSTFPWTVRHGDDEGKEVRVWLSRENQDNFKAKHDAAIMYPELVRFPMTYKISEDKDENAVFEVFQDIEELAQFYLSGSNYIQQCYEAGWDRKKAIDWSEYEEALDRMINPEPEPSEDEEDVPSEPADGEPQEESSDNPSEESDEPVEEEESPVETEPSDEPVEEEESLVEEEPIDEEPEAEEPAEEEPEPAEPSDEAEEEPTEKPSEEEETT